jgi:hypothetical protein
VSQNKKSSSGLDKGVQIGVGPPPVLQCVVSDAEYQDVLPAGSDLDAAEYTEWVVLGVEISQFLRRHQTIMVADDQPVEPAVDGGANHVVSRRMSARGTRPRVDV